MVCSPSNLSDQYRSPTIITYQVSKPVPDSEPWVSLKDVAAHLGVSEVTIRRYIANKEMPAHKAGRAYRFRLNEVDRWFSQGGAAADSSTAADSDTIPNTEKDDN